MTHTNDAQTVHTCQTRSVCKPRPSAYIQGPACINTITSDPRPVFEALLVFKARLLFEEIRYFKFWDPVPLVGIVQATLYELWCTE